MAIELTRNFCIIAHIDHGKTTLSDRLLERTGTIQERERQDQLLDSMDLERERGITIKAHPVAMRYTSKDGETYRLNLLDTPGHVDFAYEVSRSLAACEGALLVIDAAQGVEAQTVANVHLAHKQGLTIIPIINKIDLPNADVASVHRQLEEILAIPAEEAIQASAKMGTGIEEILEAIVKRIPPPRQPADQTLRALVFDSVFDVFRCGFLGLLHMEIIQERLRREYNMDIIATSPSVVYEVVTTRGEKLLIDNPAHLPDPSLLQEIREPIVKAYVLCPNENIGDILQLILEKRGHMERTESLDTRRVMLHCELPLNEILVDFNDKIKSITRGYGPMDYEQAGYRTAKLVKLDVLVNGEPVDAFSTIVHKDRAEARGRQLAAKLKEVIPRQLYQVAIQAAIGGKIIARESVSALRKNVTAKCYGGDITRKRKLLEKQKEGKKRMKSIGKINIPQEAFIEVLKAQ